MPQDAELWTLGRWHARPGKAAEFRQTWEEFAIWTLAHQEGAGQGFLLQDEADPNLFYSAGPWRDAQVIAAWRSGAEFGAFVARIRDLCDDFEPHTLRLAARASAASA
jgi:quinol monooxygenase YgiN